MDRELDRDAARLADAFTDSVGQHQMMTVARAEVGTGLGDADDRPAAAQFVDAEAEIQIAFR